MKMAFSDKEERLLKRLKEVEESVLDDDRQSIMRSVGVHFENVFQYMQVLTSLREIEGHQEKCERAVSSLESLNKLSEKLGIEPFADIDMNDQRAVSDFIFHTMMEDFWKGIGERK